MRIPRADPGHVLVADDDPGVRYVVTWALEAIGLHVKTVASGEEAVQSIAQELPSLVVLDLTMPVGSGRSVTQQLKSRNESVPILVVTGDGNARDKARSLGAYGYLHKPFEVNDLVAAVKQGLDSHM